MPTQLRLPMAPGGAEAVNADVAMVRRQGQTAYFAAGVPRPRC